MSRLTKPDVEYIPDLEQSQEAFEIAVAVSEEYGVKLRDIYEHRRMHPLPEARFMVWFILYSRGFTYSHLARLFNCTHGAVMNGVAQFKGYLEVDPKVMRRWEKLAHLSKVGDFVNEYVAELKGSCVVRSNQPLSESAITERAKAQAEAGLVLLNVSRINKQEGA